MSDLSGKRDRPFYLGIHKRLLRGDIRRNVISHLQHELEGVIPPYGKLNEKLRWAEIGVILSDPDPKNIKMVWICIPNNIKDNDFERKYRKAIKTIEKKALNFTYTDLTLNLHDPTRVSKHLRNLLKSHFITLKKERSDDCKFKCHSTCNSTHKITDDLCKTICDAVTDVVGCTQQDVCDWFTFVKDTFNIDAKLAHTFFLILKPGTYFHEDPKTLQKNIIGSALFIWDSDPPEPKEILSLRRSIINTLGLELGGKLQLLELSMVAAGEIPALIDLSKRDNPFNIADDDAHNDKDLGCRRNICKIIALKEGAKVCSNCPTTKVPINNKTFETYKIGTVRRNDFCGGLDEYKGMFQRNHTQIFMGASKRNVFKNSQGSLFQAMVKYFDLNYSNIRNISIDEKLSSIKLPYCPSWLFLATIKLLSDRIKASKIELKQSNSQWCMPVYFPLNEGADPVASRKDLVDAIESRPDKGGTSSAILDVLYGRLGALREHMAERYPDDHVVRAMCGGSNKRLMGYKINCNADNLIVCFKWPLDE